MVRSVYFLKVILIVGLVIVSYNGHSQNSNQISIDEAYNLVLKNSPTLLTESLSLAIQKDIFKLGIRDFLPQLSLSAKDDTTVNQFASDTYNRAISFTLTQPLFQGGKLIFQRKFSKGKIKVAELKLTATKYELLKRVWEQYFEIIQIQNEVAIRKKTLSTLKEQQTIVEYQKTQGTITDINYIETKIKVKTEEISLQKSQQKLYSLKLAFSSLLHISSPEIQPFTLVPFEINHQPLSISTQDYPMLIELAKNNSLELKEQKIALEEARINITKNNLQFLPQLSVRVNGGVSGSDFPLTSYNYSLGLNLQFANWGSPITNSNTFSSSGNDSLSLSESVTINPLSNITQLKSNKSLKLEEKKIKNNIDISIRKIEDQIPQLVKTIAFQQEEYQLNVDLFNLEKDKKDLAIKQNELGLLTSIQLVEYLVEFQKFELNVLQAEFNLQKSIKEFEFLLGIYEGSIYNIL